MELSGIDLKLGMINIFKMSFVKRIENYKNWNSKVDI